MTSQIGYLKLLITRINFSGRLDFEIKRVTCTLLICSSVKHEYLRLLGTLELCFDSFFSPACTAFQWGGHRLFACSSLWFNYTTDIYTEGLIAFVLPFVCLFVLMSVTFMEFTTKFSTKLHESFSSGVYLTNYSSESIHIWTMGTLEGLLPCHEFWPQGSCPGVGLEVKN